MNVKLFFTQVGQMIGEVINEEEAVVESCGASLSTVWTVKNPVLVAPGQSGVSIMEMMAFSSEDTIEITQDQLVIGIAPIDVVLELKNHYSKTHGSGIVVAGAGSLA